MTSGSTAECFNSAMGDRETWSELAPRLARLGVRPEDVHESFTRSGGPGGQNVNKVETAVVLTHAPTGVSVRCQESRSQDANRRIARLRLVERLERLRADREARDRHEREKVRRRNRGRSKASKARLVEGKRHRSSVKRERRRRDDD
jgi:protein subunit release factor B